MPALTLELASTQSEIARGVAALRSFASEQLPESSSAQIILALEELLRNAYEHGNLGITFEEKSKLLDEDRFEAALVEREVHAVGRSVRVSLDISADTLRAAIEDDGAGFDWRSPRGPSREDLHGRGLALVRKVFDTVMFEKNGARVCVVKKL